MERLKSSENEAAWQRFVSLYGPLIFFWGKQTGLSSTDSADIVQEILTQLVSQLSTFKYDANQRFRGWLRTLTVNRARDVQRREAIREAIPIQHTLQAPTDAIGDINDEDDRRFLARRALELMKSEFRDEIWRACWESVVEGKSASEISQSLGISKNSVYLAKSRVLSHLREELAGLLE